MKSRDLALGALLAFTLFTLWFKGWQHGVNVTSRVYDELLYREEVTSKRLLSRYLHTDSMFNSIFTLNDQRVR